MECNQKYAKNPKTDKNTTQQLNTRSLIEIDSLLKEKSSCANSICNLRL